VEGFTDAFFAIVITLLVLDLRVPESDFGLTRRLSELWTVFFAYLISFVNIYILWVSHHELMRLTTRADTRFLYLNGMLLLGIAVMPFSTALLADQIRDDYASLAAGVYTGVLLWVALCFRLLWRYLARHPERLIDSVSAADRRRIGRTYTSTLALYAAAFALSWVTPVASIAITLALGVFFAVIDRVSGFASEDVAEDDDADADDADAAQDESGPERGAERAR
jgi:uncharacterized membrane protein